MNADKHSTASGAQGTKRWIFSEKINCDIKKYE